MIKKIPYSYIMLGKITKIIGMHRTTLASIPLFQRLLARVAVVVMLAFLAALLIGVLIVGCIIIAYNLLISNGLSPEVAMSIMGGVILLMIIILWMAVVIYARGMYDISKKIIATQYPVANRVSGVANAFIDGIFRNPANN